MPDGYSSHRDYIAQVSEDAAKRKATIEAALREAFAGYIEKREVEVILFVNVSVFDLADSLMKYPAILKPLLSVCNIAARAIERDLDIKNVNTYKPKLNKSEASAIAGYMKPFLPPYLEIPSLSNLDRVEFIDKEIRKAKGRWERKILEALNLFGAVSFKKRLFEAGGERFELDAATPVEGPIQIGIDIKRIEARRDIHKRIDEIVNKAAKLKSTYAQARFAAVIYYPFIDEHINIQRRLASENIDDIYFASAGDSSITNTVKMLLKRFGVAK